MTRFLHICLMLTALLGLIGQSTAMAMAPARPATSMTNESMNRSTQASMADMDCMDMANAPAPGKPPCKKMTLQCMVAMGCAPLAMVEPVEPSTLLIVINRVKSALPLATRLWGRSYGPEPDPPSFLI